MATRVRRFPFAVLGIGGAVIAIRSARGMAEFFEESKVPE